MSAGFFNGLFLGGVTGLVVLAALRWIEILILVRELMKIAKDECGPHFEAHKMEISWQCQFRARSIRAGMDAGTQRAALRSYVRRYCMAEGSLREDKRHG